MSLHLPNSGRMRELLRPGTSGMASLIDSRLRATHGTLLLVRHRGRWVGVNAHTPNRLFEEALRSRGWFVQRNDAHVLRPYADPAFPAAMARAAAHGVEFYAYTSRVSPQRITILRQIPVETPRTW